MEVVPMYLVRFVKTWRIQRSSDSVTLYLDHEMPFIPTVGMGVDNTYRVEAVQYMLHAEAGAPIVECSVGTVYVPEYESLIELARTDIEEEGWTPDQDLQKWLDQPVE